MSVEKFENTYSYKLIYVISIPYETHKGLLKVGDATLKTNTKPDFLLSNSDELNFAAHNRIQEYTGTASIPYNLLYTELAIRQEDGYTFSFRDYDIQEVLKNSNVKQIHPNGKTGDEWYLTNLEMVKEAIKAFKAGKQYITSANTSFNNNQKPIIFRDEQKEAIEQTLIVFKKDKEMLWFAKMRFGKTLSALEVVRRAQYRKVIIITHRPVVDDGWSEDYSKIFFSGNSENDYTYVRKTKDSNYIFDEKTDVENDLKIQKLDKDETHFIYFASIQDLRGSKIVGGNYNKNNAVFALTWDLIIIDEAHEGTQTELGDNVISKLRKDNTRVLALSGTPFNLLNQYSDNNVFTWDYVMEQKRKFEWDKLHYGDHNPYADLPTMHIYTYDLGDVLRNYVSDEYESKAFNFREFFRVWDKGPNKNRVLPPNAQEGKFVHEADVKAFLDLMVTDDDNSNYPFANQEYRDMFRHTLWVVPGVKEARALSELLRKHPMFMHFGIANVAGEGDLYEEEHTKEALELVRKTIKDNKYTITLSCGKLTTGVTVKEWSAVFMLSGSYSTAASQYMQTIFRVQSAGSINGKQKTDCYVFDFAPDRTLKVLTEAVHISRKPGKNDKKRREVMQEFINYCPVIAISGSTTVKYSVESMMEKIKQVYADRAVNSGFEDESLYNDELLKLNDIDASKFNELKTHLGATKANKSKGDIPVNEQGLTDEQIATIDVDEPPTKAKQKIPLTPEQIAKNKAKEARKKAIDILRGISIRMPLMIYGANVPIEEDIDINRFVELVDEESWSEFMPEGVTKELFGEFTKYYDRDVFIAAGKRIRKLAAIADRETPTKRIALITNIFKYFKNPDKETVLTPWRVVNMHMGVTLGGWNFYKTREHDSTVFEQEQLEEPYFINNGDITTRIFNGKSRILEINSKTGLYPLYLTYSFYKQKLNGLCDDDFEPEECQKLWNEAVQDNIYVICKTPMAKSITRRTLCGYSEIQINAEYYNGLVKILEHNPKQFREEILKGKFWKKEDENMMFDAVVGNPPYQETVKLATNGNNNNTVDIYPYFRDVALTLSKVVSLIYPAKELQRGSKNTLDTNLVKVRIYNGSNKEGEKNIPGEPSVFGNAVRRIPGDVGVFLWDKEHPSATINYQGQKIERSKNILPIRKEFFPLALRLVNYAGTGKDYNIRKCCESNFVQNNPNSVLSIIEDRKKDVPLNYSKVITNDKGGSGGKAGWYYIKTTDLDYVQPEVFKVVLSSAYPNESFKNPKNIEILEKNEMFGRTKKCIYYSDNLVDAENYVKYVSTSFVKAIAQMTPYSFLYYLPDFNLIKDKIDWTKSISDIDDALFTEFLLSKQERDIVKANI